MPAILPGDLFAGYEYVAAGGDVTANSIVIPLTALPQLSVEEAAEADGDGAQLIRAIDMAAHAALLALPEGEAPTTITPTTFTEQTSTNTRTIQYSRRYAEVAPAQVYDLVPED
jgi:hypothetical protein